MTGQYIEEEEGFYLSHSWKMCAYMWVNPDFELKFNPYDAAGIDVWIENVREDQCLRIRERRQVKIGHVAIGISDQVRDNSVIMTKEGVKDIDKIFKTGES